MDAGAAPRSQHPRAATSCTSLAPDARGGRCRPVAVHAPARRRRRQRRPVFPREPAPAGGQLQGLPGQAPEQAAGGAAAGAPCSPRMHRGGCCLRLLPPPPRPAITHANKPPPQAEEVHAALSLQEQARDAELQAQVRCSGLAAAPRWAACLPARPPARPGGGGLGCHTPAAACPPPPPPVRCQVSALSADQQKRLAPFLAYPVLRRLVQSLTNQQPAGSQRADGSPAGAVASLAEWADNPRVLASECRPPAPCEGDGGARMLLGVAAARLGQSSRPAAALQLPALPRRHARTLLCSAQVGALPAPPRPPDRAAAGAADAGQREGAARRGSCPAAGGGAAQPRGAAQRHAGGGAE